MSTRFSTVSPQIKAVLDLAEARDEWAAGLDAIGICADVSAYEKHLKTYPFSDDLDTPPDPEFYFLRGFVASMRATG